MFKNIGRKIKGLAKVLFWLEFVLFIIAGVAVFAVGMLTLPTSANDEMPIAMALFLALGILVIGIGFLISWISSFFMYGYGELIDKTAEVAKNTAKEEPQSLPYTPFAKEIVTEEAVVTE